MQLALGDLHNVANLLLYISGLAWGRSLSAKTCCSSPFALYNVAVFLHHTEGKLGIVDQSTMNTSDQQTSSDEKIIDESGPQKHDVNGKILIETAEGELVNPSGHKDQLQRHYGILSICGLALTIDNAWVALGGSIVVSISKCEPSVQLCTWTDLSSDNGGPPGLIYEFLVACLFYAFIAASIAEVTWYFDLSKQI